ncbi:hypothetical protein DSO57_1033099 [Entomophthora muscae]|uniref:Uncharacterized protein n=1 Tax=Entomophthora muscae TaxID=34485 RepID=A0ACC2TM39_9FUNG|nr:hypothetical protein DSO57_1033099 [Entomophthora muscae]
MLRNGDRALGGAPYSSTSQQPQKVKHDLVKKTFYTLKACDYCRPRMWGLVKQGITCQTCGCVCHPDCSKHVAELKCTPRILDKRRVAPFFPSSKKKQAVKSDGSQGSLLRLNKEHSEAIRDLINGDQPLPTARAAAQVGITLNASPVPTGVSSSEEPTNMKGLESTKAPSKKDNQLISTFRNLASLDLNSSNNSKLHASPVPQSKLSLDEFIHGFVQSMKQQELERSRKNPPLSFMTTFMQNIAQFVPRVTGLRILYENAVKLFTWETPKNSWGVFFIYVLVCLRPVWLVILPFVAMRFQKSLKEGSEIESGLSSPKERGDHHKKGACMLQSPNLIPSFEKDFMAAREISGKYVLNMQFIQNMMGTHVQTHKQNEKKWKQVKEENRYFWLTVKYLPSFLALYYAFSAQSFFLIFGCYVFLGNNPYARALVVNLSPLVADKLNSHCNLSALVLKVRAITKSKVSNGPRAITISIFENQRYLFILINTNGVEMVGHVRLD